MPRKMTRQAAPNRDMTEADFARYYTEWLKEKEFAEKATKSVETKKAVIKKFVGDHGYADEHGHIYYEVDGQPTAKLERRKSQSLDHARAKVWLEANNLWTKFSVVVPAHRRLDEDAFLGAGYEGEISQAVIDGLMVESETFALKPVK